MQLCSAHIVNERKRQSALRQHVRYAGIRAKDACIYHYIRRRLQEERGYQRGWCYRMLRLRWGEEVTRRFNIRMET